MNQETNTNQKASSDLSDKELIPKYIAYKKKPLIVLGVALLLVASFFMGQSSAGKINLESIGLNVVNQEPPVNLTTVNYDLLWKTLKVVNTQYVDKPVDQEELMLGAAKGLVRALGDTHSQFLTPKENEQFKNDLQGNFEGIGAEIGVRNNVLTIIAPLPNTPAQNAGIRAQDVILEIDGQESLEMGVNEAVSKIRGPKGSTITLKVLHRNESTPEDITITRDTIHIDSVEYEVKNVNGKNIAYLKLVRFGPDTTSLFQGFVNQISRQNIDGVVLDMRNNPGGLLDTSIDISSFWLTESQIVVKELDANKNEYRYFPKNRKGLGDYKTVVLINGGSASASEIVAGALKDHDYATIVGETSYGKGSVQDIVELGGGAAVKITIAKWLTPEGHYIHEQGIEPDVVVEMTSDDYENDKDPQLEKALEIF